MLYPEGLVDRIPQLLDAGSPEEGLVDDASGIGVSSKELVAEQLAVPRATGSSTSHFVHRPALTARPDCSQMVPASREAPLVHHHPQCSIKNKHCLPGRARSSRGPSSPPAPRLPRWSFCAAMSPPAGGLVSNERIGLASRSPSVSPDRVVPATATPAPWEARRSG